MNKLVTHNILSVIISDNLLDESLLNIKYLIKYYTFSNGYVAVVEDKNNNIEVFSDLRKKNRLITWRLDNNDIKHIQDMNLSRFENKFFNQDSIFITNTDKIIDNINKNKSKNIRGVFRFFGKSAKEINEFKQLWLK